LNSHIYYSYSTNILKRPFYYHMVLRLLSQRLKVE